ncbi:hypothetical protein AKJ52_01645 [candidate division MSBL1 archaeon SCGC-AAA382C18]|uniref:EamA domain-containing protein n=1 Tax=candidate division MSBL1 archaeon SCGC-AAA382C18 TaxID=1698281 RepID=A0A133VK08_9EURY|nr:hypothetical protein AKJ52_01645 [candidate division MSBL1 archaeon SCGC-AAA382C18]
MKNVIYIWSVGPGLANLNLYMVLPFVTTGVIANVFGLIATTMAIHEIGASRAHALTSASPLVTAVLGNIFLGEKLTIYLWLGLIMIIFGGGTLSYRIYGKQSSQKAKRPVFGFGLALYVTIVIGTIAVLQKYGLNLGVTPLQGLFIRFGTAAILYGIYLLITRPELNIKSSYQSPDYLWASILMTGAALLFLLALARLPATLVEGLKRTAPLFTVALSAFLLRGIEEVDWQTFCLAAIIVAGAILAMIS